MPTTLAAIASKLRAAMATAWGVLRTWLAPVPGAIKDRINARELVRVLVTAILAGGGLGPILAAISASLHLIVPGLDPSWTSTAIAILTAAAESIRRYHQADEHDADHAPHE